MLQAVPSLLVANTGPEPITQVQKKGYASAGASTTHTVILDAIATAGNLLIMGVVGDFVVSPLPPNGRWSATSFKSAVDGTGTYLFWCISNGGEQAITVVIGGSSSCCIGVLEYKNLSILDASATATGQGAATIGTGTTGSTTKVYELLITVAGIINGGSPVPTVSSWNNSFTTELSGSSSVAGTLIGFNMASRIVTAVSTYTSTATLSSNAATNCSGIIASFY